MAFQIIRDNIARVHADIIVNTANPEVTVGGGVDTAIFEAAGREQLLRERAVIGRLAEGEIGVTPAFHLHAKNIVHVSGPIWKGGADGEREILRECYKRTLNKAVELGCESIAFPLISTGSYGFPREEALRIALEVFTSFLLKYDIEIYLVVFDKKSVSVSEKMFSGLQKYVDENYVDRHLESEYGCGRFQSSAYPGLSEKRLPPPKSEEESDQRAFAESEEESDRRASVKSNAKCDREAPTVFPSIFLEREPRHNLEHYMEEIDDSFSMYLQQLINRKHLKNADIYKRANLNKQYFSKLIHGQINPTKEKLLAIAVALELNMDEVRDLLMMAGYAMSPCNKVDVVVAFFIRSHKYNMFDIEIALYDMGLPTLSGY